MNNSGTTSLGNTIELQKDLADTKEKLKIITQKFANTRKERDQLKSENREEMSSLLK